MNKKERSTPKLVKDADNEQERDYIFQDNKKTRFGAGFIIVVLILLIIAVLSTAYFLDWF
jgi:hypothetical protein